MRVSDSVNSSCHEKKPEKMVKFLSSTHFLIQKKKIFQLFYVFIDTFLVLLWNLSRKLLGLIKIFITFFFFPSLLKYHIIGSLYKLLLSRAVHLIYTACKINWKWPELSWLLSVSLPVIYQWVIG